MNLTKNSNELFILYKNGEWKPVSDMPKYNGIYEKIKSLLFFYHKSNNNFTTYNCDIGGIIICIYELQRHRGTTICFCNQFDPVTQGHRILAYGISHPEDAIDYGIGTTLIDIKPENVNNPYKGCAFLL